MTTESATPKRKAAPSKKAAPKKKLEPVKAPEVIEAEEDEQEQEEGQEQEELAPQTKQKAAPVSDALPLQLDGRDVGVTILVIFMCIVAAVATPPSPASKSHEPPTVTQESAEKKAAPSLCETLQAHGLPPIDC